MYMFSFVFSGLVTGGGGGAYTDGPGGGLNFGVLDKFCVTALSLCLSWVSICLCLYVHFPPYVLHSCNYLILLSLFSVDRCLHASL